MKSLTRTPSEGFQPMLQALGQPSRINYQPSPHDLVIEAHMDRMKVIFDATPKRSERTKRVRIFDCMKRLNAVRRPEMVEHLERKMGILLSEC